MSIFCQRSLIVFCFLFLGGLQASDVHEDGATSSVYSIGPVQDKPHKMALGYIVKSPEVNDQGIDQSDLAFQRTWNLFKDVVRKCPGVEENNCFKHVRSALDALYDRGLEGDERCCMDYIYAHMAFYAETLDPEKSAQARLRLNNLNTTILEEKIPNRFFNTEMKAGILYMLGYMNLYAEGGLRDEESARKYFTTLQQAQYVWAKYQGNGLFFLSYMHYTSKNYSAARLGFTSILNNLNLHPKLQLCAQRLLLDMQLERVEGPRDYNVIRKILEIYVNNPLLLERRKIEALRLLSYLQFQGSGGARDYESARKGLEVCVKGAQVAAAQKLEDLRMLSHMKFHGLGGDKDYDAVEKNLMTIVNTKGAVSVIQEKIPMIRHMLLTIRATKHRDDFMNQRPGPALGARVLQKRTAPGSSENPSHPKRARGAD